MKKLITFLASLTLISIASIAGEGTSSGGSGWSKILKSQDMAAVFPKHQVGDLSLRYNQFCINKSGEPQTKSTYRVGDDKTQAFTHFIAELSDDCALWKNANKCYFFKKEKNKVPPYAYIPVYKWDSNKNESGGYVMAFRKKYTLPKCRK